MFQTPMSSPMMNRMLGFLPPAGLGWPPSLASAWASSSPGSAHAPQHGAGEELSGLSKVTFASAEAAPADQLSHWGLDAAAYPSSAPAAANTTARTFVLRNIDSPSLKNRERKPRGSL